MPFHQKIAARRSGRQLPASDDDERRRSRGALGSPVIYVVLTLAALLNADAWGQEVEEAGSLPVAESLLDVFNKHDPQQMAALVTADFELYYVDEEGVASLALRGPDQLVEEMTKYFASRPSVQSSITGAIDGPVYVSFREQIVGGQSAIAVYEVRDRLIKRVWYYPAE